MNAVPVDQKDYEMLPSLSETDLISKRRTK